MGYLGEILREILGKSCWNLWEISRKLWGNLGEISGKSRWNIWEILGKSRGLLRYFWVLIDTFGYFHVLPGTLEVLLDTLMCFWVFLVFLGTSWYLKVLLGPILSHLVPSDTDHKQTRNAHVKKAHTWPSSPSMWSNLFKSFCLTKSYISSAVLYLHLRCSCCPKGGARKN